MKMRAYHNDIHNCHRFVSMLPGDSYGCTIHSVSEKRNLCSGKVWPFLELRSGDTPDDMLY